MSNPSIRMKNYLREAVLTTTLSVSFLLPSIAANHNGEYSFRQVGFSDGLSHSSVLSLFQDNTGLVWLGTYDGLNCYDGSSMYVCRSDFSAGNTLSNNIISNICQADGDNLWVDTFLSLNLLSKTSGEVTRTFSFQEDRFMSSNTKGNTWLICADTLYYYSTAHRKFVFTDEFCLGELPHGRFFVDEQGTLMYFMRDEGTVLKYSLSSWTADSTNTKVTVKEERFHPKPINDIFYQTGMMCFVDEDMDLYMYDVERKTKVYIRNLESLVEKYGDICSIVPFYEDFLIGFTVNGLFRLKAFDKYQAESIDRNIRIFCLYHDLKQGVVWLGTDGHGALMYSKKYAIADNVLLSSISDEFSRPVRCMMTDKFGGLWIGTKGDGIIHIPDYSSGSRNAEVITPKKRTSAEVYQRDPREFKVYAMQESRYRDGVWVGAGPEGLMFCPYNGLPHRFGQDLDLEEVHSIYEKDANTLYVASAGWGLHKLTLSGDNVVFDKDYSFFSEGRRIELFYGMTSVGDSLLYLGSRGSGVVRLDLRNDEYRVISMKYLNKEASDDVLSICSASDGSLYVGTVSGLMHLSNSESSLKAEYIGRKNGLPNDMIHGILEDEDGMIWLGTDRGLVKYNPVNSSAHTYLYTAGVEVAEFSDDAYYKDKYNGRIIFGGINGVMYLEARTPVASQYYADIQLRKLEVGHEEVKMSDYLDHGRLTFRGSRVSFALTYSAPDYQASGLMEYSCFLEGYDSDWSVFSLSNTSTYSDVPPGKYTLRVRCKKDVTDVCPREFSIEVRVKRGFMGSPVMSAIVMALIIGLLLYCVHLFCKARRGESIIQEDRRSGLERRRDLGVLFADAYDCALTSRKGINDISADVLRMMASRGADISGIEVHAVDEPFPVFANFMRRLLLVVYGHIVTEKVQAVVDAGVKDGLMHLSVKSAAARGLKDALEGRKDDLSCDYCEDIKLQLSFLQVAVNQGLIDKITLNGTGESTSLELIFSPASSKHLAPADRDKVLLLESSEETAWLISDLLSADYEVINAADTILALRSLNSSDIRLVIVDVHNYSNDEKVIIDILSRNRASLSEIPVVAFTGDKNRMLAAELISRSDSYLDYVSDIHLLKDVISRALHGKKDFRHIRLEELGSLSEEIVCSNEEDIAFVRKTIQVLSENIAREDLSTTLLADRLAMTPRSFYRKFRSVSRISPGSLIKIYRLEMAARLLRDESRQIQDVIAEVGISSRSYFYKEFTARFGTTPGNWKTTQKGSAEEVCSK